MARDSEHLPREFVVLTPEDVLLNPPWQWHKIVSKYIVPPPFNLLLSKIGLSLGGYPPLSAATEHDN